MNSFLRTSQSRELLRQIEALASSGAKDYERAVDNCQLIVEILNTETRND